MKQPSEGWILLGVVMGVGVVLLSRSTSAMGTSQVPKPTTTPQRPVQQRPMSSATRAAITVFQQQLQDMGYRITATDGIIGPETQAAARAFVSDHRSQVDSTRSRYDPLPNPVGLLYLTDDVYRAGFHLPAATG